jgi:hypothetical protein
MPDKIGKSLFSSVSADLTSVTKDVAEAALDSITKGEFLKNVPILNTVHSLVKAGFDIREHLFINKVLKFLFELKDIPLHKRQDFVYQLEEGEFQKNAGEKVIAILDKLDDSDKASYVGKLFRATINGKLDFDDFLRLSYIINYAFLEDLRLLKSSFHADGHVATYHLSEINASKLYRIGLASATIVPDSASIARRERYRETNKPIDYKTEYKLNNDAYVITRELFDFAWIEDIYNIYKK